MLDTGLPDIEGGVVVGHWVMRVKLPLSPRALLLEGTGALSLVARRSSTLKPTRLRVISLVDWLDRRLAPKRRLLDELGILRQLKTGKRVLSWGHGRTAIGNELSSLLLKHFISLII